MILILLVIFSIALAMDGLSRHHCNRRDCDICRTEAMYP